MSRRYIATFAAVAALAGVSGMATSAHASVDAPPATPGGVSLTDDKGSIRPSDDNKGVSLTDDKGSIRPSDDNKGVSLTGDFITKYCSYSTGDFSVTLRCNPTPEYVNVWVDAICTTRMDMPPVRISTDIMEVGPRKSGTRTAHCPDTNGYSLAYVEGIATERD